MSSVFISVSFLTGSVSVGGASGVRGPASVHAWQESSLSHQHLLLRHCQVPVAAKLRPLQQGQTHKKVVNIECRNIYLQIKQQKNI